MHSSVKPAVLIIAVALCILVISVGFPSLGEFFHTQGHVSYYTDEPYARYPQHPPGNTF